MSENQTTEAKPTVTYWETIAWMNLSRSGKMGIFIIDNQKYGVSMKLLEEFACGNKTGCPIKKIPPRKPTENTEG